MQSPIRTDPLTTCTEAVLKDTLADVAFQGGHAPLPQEVFSTFAGDISLYGKAPSKEEIVAALEYEAQKQLQRCKKEEKIQTALMLTEGALKATVTYGSQPITVHVPVQLLAAHRVAVRILAHIEKDPLVIPATKILELQKQEKVDISEMWDDETVIYFITPHDGLPLVWIFAVRQ